MPQRDLVPVQLSSPGRTDSGLSSQLTEISRIIGRLAQPLQKTRTCDVLSSVVPYKLRATPHPVFRVPLESSIAPDFSERARCLTEKARGGTGGDAV